MKDMKCSRVGAGVFEILRCLTPRNFVSLRVQFSSPGSQGYRVRTQDRVREHGKWKVLYVAKDKFGRAVADMELCLGKIAMGRSKRLLFWFYDTLRRNDVIFYLRTLDLTAATKEPVQEVLDTSADSQNHTQ